MRVAVWHKPDSGYPSNPPFDPSKPYPEYRFGAVSEETNDAYDGVREAIRLLGLDAEHYGSSEWNPLGDIIRPGDTVLLKPNLIKESHPRDKEGWIYMMTHGSIVRAVADFVIIALDGGGKIIVADAPQTDSSFSEIANRLGLYELGRFYTRLGVQFELRDLRKFEWRSDDDVIMSRMNLPGDPDGYTKFDLKINSAFHGHSGEGKYYGADYDTAAINDHHTRLSHEYVISSSAVNCDVFINLPKLKTHKKTGMTLSLKNLVGINGDKNYLPHYTQGTPEDGGDQFPSCSFGRGIESSGLPVIRKLALKLPGIGPRLYKSARIIGKFALGNTSEVIRSGNWYGNDTAWRMCLDLNRILLHGNPDGTMCDDSGDPPKRYVTIIDGIIGGDGNGPIDVDPYRSGIVVAGLDPVVSDATAAYIAGIDPQKLAVIRGAFNLLKHRLTSSSIDNIEVNSNNPLWCKKLSDINPSTVCRFRPHFGWKGAIELPGAHDLTATEHVSR